MNWLNKIVDKIIEKYPNEDIYVCECGLSTTGVSHIGNFRELLITYFVSKELERRGKKTKIILSFDDFDRLKKITKETDSSFEKYIGMPTYSLPSPQGEHYSYADYYENLVINELGLLGIDMKYIKQSEKYMNGSYDDYIKMVLDKKDKIYDIITNYKTKKFIEKNKYYPISLYCSKCLKDSTNILNYDKNNHKIEYECECGYHEINNIKALKVKLNFSIDWPMRWNYENVVFEACGKGHADKNGALNVSRDISQYIFGARQPISLAYEFVNFKGVDGRLNKNSKHIVTITDALEILPKDMILWMFLNNNPKKVYSISFDDSIIKLYTDYEKMLTTDDESHQQIKYIIGKSTISAKPEFEKLIRFLPIANFEIENLKKYVDFDENNKEHLRKIKYAYNWLQKYNSKKYWKLSNNFNHDYWSNIPENQKEILHIFSNILNGENAIKETEKFINELKKDKETLKAFSKNFYNMIFGIDEGIPIKSIVENYNISEILKKLTPDQKNYNQNQNEIAILHLSDLHFDINDSKETLDSKWNEMISLLKKSKIKVNYLVITGDSICFYNMNENFDIAANYINDLIDQLKINKNNVILCMGNHEMQAYGEQDNISTLFDDFDSNIKPKIDNYNKFQSKINNKEIKDENDMYYIKAYDNFTFFVINSLYYLDDNNKGLFLHDIQKIRDVLASYIPERDKYKILITHAQDNYSDELNKKTDMLNNFNIRICGHRHPKQNITQINKRQQIDLISGNPDGLIEEENSYNLYVLNNDKLDVKKIRYRKKWNIE